VRGGRELVVGVVRRLGGHDGDRALLAPETALDVERRPRTLRLVLGDDVGQLAGMAERATIERAGARAAHVPHDEAQGPSDGQIAAPTGAEEIVAAVDLELPGHRA